MLHKNFGLNGLGVWLNNQIEIFLALVGYLGVVEDLGPHDCDLEANLVIVLAEILLSSP
jgi:hypothetical protein